MSVTLDEILDRMKSDSSPEADFVSKLAEQTPETEFKPTPKTEKVAEGSDDEKIAAMIEDEGRLFARVFVDELNKIATEKSALNPPTGITPDVSPMLQMNPAVNVSVAEDGRAVEVDRVSAILNSMTGMPTNPAAKIEFEAPDGGQMATPSAPMGAQPTAAEIAKAQEAAAAARQEAARKTGSVNVISALYEQYFGGN